MRKALIIFSGFLFLFSLNINAQELTSQPKTITIGAIFNLSGAQSSLDAASWQGAQLAISEINANGGLLGKPVKLDVIDSKSEESLVTTAAEKLASLPNIAGAIIGLNDTDMALAAIPAIAAKQKLFIAIGATSPRLSAIAPLSVVYACFVDSDQAAAAAEFAHEKLNAKNALTIAESDNEYTRLLGSFFQQYFSQNDGKIIENITITQNKLNLLPKLKNIKEKETQPEVIYLAASPANVTNLIQQIRRAGFQQPIIGGDGFDIPDLAAKNTNYSNIFFTAHAFINKSNPDKNVSKFISSYEKSFILKPNTGFSALGYDTVKILAQAITKAQSTDADKIRLALLDIKNYDGITGTFSYLNENPIPIKSVTIVKIDDSKKTFVTEWVPKSSFKS